MYIDSDGVHIVGTTYDTGYGRLERPIFRWKGADEIYIGAGAYHHSGTTEQLLYWNSELTFELEAAGSNSLSDNYDADGWHYIYLDDAAIVTQASALLDKDCFRNETTAPTYSASKHGWYSGNDRCIFAVYETGSALLEFYHTSGNFVSFGAEIADITIQDVDASWEDAESALTIPGFATKASVHFYSAYNDQAGNLFWRTNGQTDTTGNRIGVFGGADSPVLQNTVDVITDSNQLFEMKFTAVANASTVNAWTQGWYFPEGM